MYQLLIVEKAKCAIHLNLKVLQYQLCLSLSKSYKNRKYIFPRCSFHFYYKSVFYNAQSKNCFIVDDI